MRSEIGGAVTRVVVDPVVRAVTHLVIEPKHGQGLGRLIPLDLVESTMGEVHLSCTLEEFDKLEIAEETQFLPGSSGHGNYGQQQAFSWPFYTIGGGVSVGGVAQAVTYDSPSLGEVGVRRGEQVHATDADIGRVQGLVIAPDTHHVTHVLLQEGHLWGRKEVAIPISAVSGIEDGIRLSLTKQEVEDLPPVELDHQDELDVTDDSSISIQSRVQSDPEIATQTAKHEMSKSFDQDPETNREKASVGDIDEILEDWSDRQRKLAQKQEEIEAEREKFLQDFKEISQNVIKPAMEAIVQRLQKDGGGGIIWDGESDSMHRPRLILWLSLKGELTGTPRQDRNPYLQLDADVAHRRIDVWEGDMWEKQGTSRTTSPWKLSEISSESITERIVGILERAANHDQAP